MSFYQIEIPGSLEELKGLTEFRIYQSSGAQKITVFFSHFPKTDQIKENWRKVSNYIAAAYQSKLTKKEDEFEKWNLYLLFTCESVVEKELRFEIENDKFSNRKIILEEIMGNLDDKRSNSLISQHITNEDLVINTVEDSKDLQDIVSKYKSSTFIWDMIKNEEPLNYKTQSQKNILGNIVKRITDENK